MLAGVENVTCVARILVFEECGLEEIGLTEVTQVVAVELAELAHVVVSIDEPPVFVVK